MSDLPFSPDEVARMRQEAEAQAGKFRLPGLGAIGSDIARGAGPGVGKGIGGFAAAGVDFINDAVYGGRNERDGGFGVLRTAADLLGADDAVSYFDALNEQRNAWRARMTPEPNAAVTEQILAPLIKGLGDAAVGAVTGGGVARAGGYAGEAAAAISQFGAAAGVGAGLGRDEEARLLEEGVDPYTARMRAWQAGIFGGGAAAVPPALGRGLASNVATGSISNMLFGMADRYMANNYLRSSGYEDAAKLYEWADPVAVTIDAVLGAGFGGLHWWSSRPRTQGDRLTPEQHLDRARQLGNELDQDGDPTLVIEAAAHAMAARQGGLVEADEVLRLLRESADDPAAFDAEVQSRLPGVMEARPGAEPEWSPVVQEAIARRAEAYVREGGVDPVAARQLAERDAILNPDLLELPRPTELETAAALAAADDLHVGISTAPGVPRNLPAGYVHREALTRAADQALRNEPIDIEGVYLQAIRAEVERQMQRRVDAGRPIGDVTDDVMAQMQRDGFIPQGMAADDMRPVVREQTAEAMRAPIDAPPTETPRIDAEMMRQWFEDNFAPHKPRPEVQAGFRQLGDMMEAAGDADLAAAFRRVDLEREGLMQRAAEIELDPAAYFPDGVIREARIIPTEGEPVPARIVVDPSPVALAELFDAADRNGEPGVRWVMDPITGHVHVAEARVSEAELAASADLRDAPSGLARDEADLDAQLFEATRDMEGPYAARRTEADFQAVDDLVVAMRAAAECAARYAGGPVMMLGALGAPAVGAKAAGLGEMVVGTTLPAALGITGLSVGLYQTGADERRQAFEEFQAMRRAEQEQAVRTRVESENRRRLAKLKRENFVLWLDTVPEDQRIDAVAEKVGVPAAYLRDMIMKESGGNYAARAGTSSAEGLTQFIDSTWRSMLRQHGAKYKLPLDPEDPAALYLKFDPAWAKLMGAHYAQDNARDLKRFIGRDPSQGEVYLAHFMGVDGAKDMILAARRGEKNAARAFPEQAAANMNVFYHGGDPSRPRTAQEVIDRQTAGFSREPFKVSQ